jgi:peroxiredoxin
VVVGSSIYYPNSTPKITTNIEKGKFKITGQVPYPIGVVIYNNVKYISGYFLIEPGSQIVNSDVNLFRKTPAIHNYIMGEYARDFVSVADRAKLKIDSLNKVINKLQVAYPSNAPDSVKLTIEQLSKNLYQESDKILLQFVTEHPDSYIGLSKLINLMDFGYEDIFDSIYAHFSDRIKSTYAGKLLYNQLSASKALAVGKRFPVMSVVDIHNDMLDNDVFLAKKYTLIDFWYSHCGPCIGQFNDLKVIYDNYQGKGFEIIGVSTDKVKFKADWQSVIKKHGLKWMQYWDVDGKQAQALSVQAFPTNYLLDSNGQIIMKDLRPVELAQFLSDHLQ